MSQAPQVLSLRELCDTCLLGLAPRAQARGWDLLALIYDDVPDLLLGDPLALGDALSRRVARIIDQATGGELVVRGLLDALLPGRCRLLLQLSPVPDGWEETEDLLVEMALAEGPLAQCPAADLSGISLLLLDPNPLAALALSHRLRRANALVERFTTADGLIARLRQPTPRSSGLLLGVPSSAGPWEAREWLETCRGPGDLPILVLLSGAQQGLTEVVREAGASGCLSRPFTNQALFDVLRTLCPTSALNDSPQDQARALEIVGGDAALAAELLNTLARSLPGDLGDLESLISAGDWGAVSALAHRLRGAAGYCALPDLGVAAETLERAAARGDAAPIYHALGEVQRQAERVCRYCAPAG